MIEIEKITQNKVLTGIIAVLLIGLISLGWQVKSLKDQVSELSKYGYVDNKDRSSLQNLLKRSLPTTNWSPFDSDWDPFSEMDRMQKEMNRMFRDSFWRGLGSQKFSLFNKNRFFDLETDIKETKSAYKITMDIPGMDKQKINIETKDNTLVVSGERRSESEENKWNTFFRRERSYGYFHRAVPLPEDARADKIKADYKRGVLKITIPKDDSKKSPDKSGIKINVS